MNNISSEVDLILLNKGIEVAVINVKECSDKKVKGLFDMFCKKGTCPYFCRIAKINWLLTGNIYNS